MVAFGLEPKTRHLQQHAEASWDDDADVPSKSSADHA
jgi:hypothetical protein